MRILYIILALAIVDDAWAAYPSRNAYETSIQAAIKRNPVVLVTGSSDEVIERSRRLMRRGYVTRGMMACMSPLSCAQEMVREK